MNNDQLFNLMKEYFGEQGIFLLRSAMDSLGLVRLSELNDLEKERLLKALMADVFGSIISGEKRGMVKSQLISIFEFSEHAIERMEQESKEDYMKMS